MPWVAMIDGRFAAARDEWFKQAEASHTTPRSRFRERPGRRSSVATPPGHAKPSRGWTPPASAARSSRSSARASARGSTASTAIRRVDRRLPRARWPRGATLDVLWDEAWTAWCALAVLGTDDPEVVTMGREGSGHPVKLRANAVIAHFDRLLGDAIGDDEQDDRERATAPVASEAAEVVEPA